METKCLFNDVFANPDGLSPKPLTIIFLLIQFDNDHFDTVFKNFKN